MLGSGQPGPAFIGVYFKPARGYLISVVGYKLSAAAVLEAARHTSFAAPATISLPVAPGPLVTRSAALRAARSSAPGRWRRATAKLSSWTETATLLAAHTMRGPAGGPAALRAAPWTPVWAVLLTGRHRSSRGAALSVVDAGTGKVVYTAPARTRWFAALTDRHPTREGVCVGGSNSRVPFGVLTRTEERYATGWRPAFWSHGTRNSTRLVLSTVRAVNHADPSMYGGCVQQDCSLRELVWVTIATFRARPGHRLSCQPPSSPAGLHFRKASRNFVVSVPNNYEFGCGQVPAPIKRLKDLAPPVDDSP